MAQRAEERREAPGGNVPNASQLVRHRGADPAGVAAEHELADRAAGVVADDGHVAEAECLDEVPRERGDPCGERSASAFIGRWCEPSGSVGA